MSDATDFRGKVAVITGAGSGIGAALARHAALLDMRIVLADVAFDVVEARAAELREAGLDAVAMRCDVSVYSEVEALAELAYDRWGQVDVLINNAGIELFGRSWQLDPEQWDRVIRVNLNGVFYGMRVFIPRMIESGRRSHVVNLASAASFRTSTGTSAYGATKHAVLALTESTGKELADAGADVLVTGVLPGAVRTPIFESPMVTEGDDLAESTRRAYANISATEGTDPDEAAALIFERTSQGATHVHTDVAMCRAFLEERHAALMETLV